jgi:hypothetical protein
MATILGITDSITTCDCCGKSNLKRTVGIELNSGEQVHYGVDCASKTLRQSYMGKTSKVSANTILQAGKWASYYMRTNQPNNQILTLIEI